MGCWVGRVLFTCLLFHGKQQEMNLGLSSLEMGKSCLSEWAALHPPLLGHGGSRGSSSPSIHPQLCSLPVPCSAPAAAAAQEFLEHSQCISNCSWLLPPLLGPNKMFLHGRLSVEFREAGRAALISDLICCKTRGREERSPF